jgi:hypothetical protein
LGWENYKSQIVFVGDARYLKDENQGDFMKVTILFVQVPVVLMGNTFFLDGSELFQLSL